MITNFQYEREVMSHPVGKHISKDQAHELNYWLKSQGFRETATNRLILRGLIDTVKADLNMKSNEHLEHKELNIYFTKNTKDWAFD